MGFADTDADDGWGVSSLFVVAVVRQVSYIFPLIFSLHFPYLRHRMCQAYKGGAKVKPVDYATLLCQPSHTHTRTAHTQSHTHFHIFIIRWQRRCHRHFLRFRNFIAGQHFATFMRSLRSARPGSSGPGLTSYTIRHCQFTWHVNNQQHTHAHTICTHVSLLACLTCCPRCRCRRFSSCSCAFQLLSVAEAAAASTASSFSSPSHTLIMASLRRPLFNARAAPPVMRQCR